MHFGEMFYGQTNIELFDHNDKRYIFGGVQLRLLNLSMFAVASCSRDVLLVLCKALTSPLLKICSKFMLRRQVPARKPTSLDELNSAKKSGHISRSLLLTTKNVWSRYNFLRDIQQKY